MTSSSGRSQGWIAVFGAPIVLGVLSLAGLLAALLFGDVGRYLSWLAVGAPVPVIAWAWLRLKLR
ncbi:hypothetical protein MTX26_22430 [Bradyrhizobium sp. ISRA443]|uniref:hypothetical protein n=1 Tax=unclassified Bradyrhizobium TaxID=2631580 RepID=UPI002478D041|nr:MULTISPECIES: hypothetical protein [unclassified Bradyrhizobium]WGR92729.1 hypothetical protein MTX20_33210 [Bradyrhizobium sp. ISRA435]WGR97185.1 hypothetical protein MTX23_22430 [Bradyrhizobium sp. ISRA436]WGS04073.1 hypothetical protein MTX18_22430 [Bradyrhizobium sp. ISRA437]WGS10956.1 hypothetical protein MTX26_22430 [Bradyrhizobium sp. ISRA443]